MLIGDEDFSDIAGQIDDDMLDDLIEYFTKNDIDKRNLILLLNSRKHIEKMLNEFDINIEKCELLDKYLLSPSLEMLELLVDKKYSNIKEFYTKKVLKEYSEHISFEKKNPSYSIPETIKNKIRFIMKDSSIQKDNFDIFYKNPIMYIEFFNEIEINALDILEKAYLKNESTISRSVYSKDTIESLVKNIGLEEVKKIILEQDENLLRIHKENIIHLLDSGLIDISYLNTLYSDHSYNDIPLYIYFFNENNINKICVEKDGQRVINPLLDLSLLKSPAAINIIFYLITSFEDYIERIFSLLPSCKIMVHDALGDNILHKVAKLKSPHYLKMALKLFTERQLDITIRNNKGENFVDKIKHASLVFMLLDGDKVFDIHSPEYIDLKKSLLNVSIEDNNFYNYHIRKKLISDEKTMIGKSIQTEDFSLNNNKKRL